MSAGSPFTGSRRATGHAAWITLLAVAFPFAASWAIFNGVRHLVRGTRNCWQRYPAVRWSAAGLALVSFPIWGLIGLLHLDRSGLPELGPFLRFEPPVTGQVFDAGGDVLIEMAREHRQIVRYADIPPVLQDAILAAEDKRFFRHSGVDYLALPRVIARTLTASWEAGRVKLPQGGSTVTQQLVRGYFLSDLTAREDDDDLSADGAAARSLAVVVGAPAAKKLMRKVEEMRLALWLEHRLAETFGSKQAAKEEILARYVSFIYMGHGRYGFAAASEYYYRKPLASYRLEDADVAATLAGLVKSPARYAPTAENHERSRARRNRVLRLMAARGALPRALSARMCREPLLLAPGPPARTKAPAALQQVLRELRHDGRFGMESILVGRIRVHTTINGHAQHVVQDALENGLRTYEARHPESHGLVQGAAVVLRNSDAAILAIAGGRQSYRGRQHSYTDYNRAVESLRQPGSTIKPILYLAALRSGTALDMPVPDAPIAVQSGNGPTKWVSNYDGTFQGEILVREALAQSRNAPALWLAQRVGIRRIVSTARDLGLERPLRPLLSTALGASEVSLLDLANLFRAIASGRIAKPYVVRQLTDTEGGVRLRYDGGRTEPVRIEPAALLRVQEGLRGTVRLPRGTAHSLDRPHFPIAVMGKTGTTNDFRDALFVGSTYGTEGVTVGVWIGFDDNRSLGMRESGARNALPVFAEIVQGLYGEGGLGTPPLFPEAIEESIGHYLARAQAAAPPPAPEARMPTEGGPPVLLAVSRSEAGADPTQAASRH